MVYNMFTCGGFGFDILGGCSIAWFVMFIVFMLALIISRQISEYDVMPFNRIGALVGGILPSFLIITLSGNFKFVFLGGLVGLFALGYFASFFLGDGEYD
ncbi:MAG TPA: hypothetical protein VMZ91_05345 [Candidatus Paceibacterota bacterium]|nr:hypothetical protein [Candidatus Paceibacterota bacterium]